MTKRATRRKEMMGVHLRSEDGNLWRWDIDGAEYGWTPDCWLFVQEGNDQRRVMFAQRIEGAVGYTMGLHDGRGQASRGNGAKT